VTLGEEHVSLPSSLEVGGERGGVLVFPALLSTAPTSSILLFSTFGLRFAKPALLLRLFFLLLISLGELEVDVIGELSPDNGSWERPAPVPSYRSIILFDDKTLEDVNVDRSPISMSPFAKSH
tara:strand:+ start:349 stop:717 length:369 start_codon:yes stop_codon:yes gene_type:complete